MRWPKLAIPRNGRREMTPSRSVHVSFLRTSCQSFRENSPGYGTRGHLSYWAVIPAAASLTECLVYQPDSMRKIISHQEQPRACTPQTAVQPFTHRLVTDQANIHSNSRYNMHSNSMIRTGPVTSTAKAPCFGLRRSAIGAYGDWASHEKLHSIICLQCR